jgi:D-alanyl-D-alanine endopeptidase (penicillin-binding protein 7)
MQLINWGGWIISALLWVLTAAIAAPTSAAEQVPAKTAAIRPGPQPAKNAIAKAAATPAKKSKKDQPDVRSNAVLVIDAADSSVLFARHATIASPIASITKLMTALVVLDAGQPLDEPIIITPADRDLEKGSASRLSVGANLSRGDLLHLALMSSDNRAAHAVGRRYPGGLPKLIAAMNVKARGLGMSSAKFVDPTGLSEGNVASAEDLARLVIAASRNTTIRRFSTDTRFSVAVGKRRLEFRNSNTLVAKSDWDIELQKTGYTNEAGRCLVMKTMIDGRSVVIVLLDSFGKYTRVADARRIRRWLEGRQA